MSRSNGLAGSALKGRRLVLAAFESHSPDRVVSMAQAIFFELATDRHGSLTDFELGMQPPSHGLSAFGMRVVTPTRVATRPLKALRDMAEGFVPSSHPSLYLTCVEAELRACVAQMMEAHKEREEIVTNANRTYDDAVANLLFKGPLVKRLLASFWPMLLRLGLLSLLSAASIALFKANIAAAPLGTEIRASHGVLSLGLGVMLTLLLGYGQDQWKNFRITSLAHSRDVAMLAADKEEAARIYEACRALYHSVDRAWTDHAPGSAFKPQDSGTLRVLEGNLKRTLAKKLPRTPMDVAKEGGARLLLAVKSRLRAGGERG